MEVILHYTTAPPYFVTKKNHAACRQAHGCFLDGSHDTNAFQFAIMSYSGYRMNAPLESHCEDSHSGTRSAAGWHWHSQKGSHEI